MPYKLQGTAVVRADTGAVVKKHPTREKALAHLRALKANVEESSSAGVLGALLEGFAAGPTVLDGRLRPGDNVRVPVKGGESVTGRVVRPSDAKPDSHVLIAPGGGAPHVEAPVKKVRHDTPEQRAQEVAKRLERGQAMIPTVKGGKVVEKPAPGGVAPGRKVQESGVPLWRSLLGEAFAAPAPKETAAQSMAIGASQQAAARKAISSGAFNSSLHPRGGGGKFRYTTGGKRAHVSRSGSSSSRLSTAGYGNYLQVGMHGALIRSIQRQLGIKADGVYGQQTRAAIMRFQTSHGLRVDGVVGAQTIAALRGNSSAARIKPGPLATKTARVVRPRISRSRRSSRSTVTGKATRKGSQPVRLGGGVRIG